MRLVTSHNEASNIARCGQDDSLSPFEWTPEAVMFSGVSFSPDRNSKLITLQTNVMRTVTFVETQVREGMLNFALKVPVRITKPANVKRRPSQPDAPIGSPREYSAISIDHPYKESGEKTKGSFSSLIVL